MEDANLKSQEVMPKTRFSFLADLHPLTVVFFIIVLTAITTYIIPGGEFKRKTVEVIGLERDVIIPGSFHAVQSIPQTFSKIWTSFMQGAIEAADVSFTIFLCAGALTAIIATGAITAGINTVVKKLQNNAHFLIPVLIFAFGLGGATYGMYEDAVPFILVIAPLMLAMKYDSMVAVMIVHFGVAVGASACFLNPFAVGIGQALAQLPMTSGIGVRVVMWFFMMAGTSIYVMRYAKKIKDHPELSLVKEDDEKNRLRYLDFSGDNIETMTAQHKIVLALIAAGFAAMIFGVMKKEWWFNEIGSIFLFMGIIIPLVGGLKLNETIEKNIEGMGTVLVAVCLLSASRVITMLLMNSKIMDTILYTISNSLSAFPKVISVWIMYMVSSVAMVFVQSSSGLGATLMPLMAPLGDLLGVSRQTVVTAYQLGTGTFGWWMPWEGICFAMCSLAGINFFKYLKKAGHFVFVFYLPASLLVLALMTIFGYK